MPRFPIVEDGRVITDEEGQEFTERDAVRGEAVETGASIARDAFIRGSASQVIDVRKGDEFPHSRALFWPWRFCTKCIAPNFPADVSAPHAPSSLRTLPIQLRQSLLAQPRPASWRPT
jgi:hypothetical protein